MRGHLNKRSRILRRLVHLPDIAGNDAHLEPLGRPCSGGDAFTKSAKRRQFKLADTIGLSVDERMKMAGFDLELGSRRRVGLFAKARQSFEPVHWPSSTFQPCCSILSVADLAASSKRAISLAGLNGRPDTTALAHST